MVEPWRGADLRKAIYVLDKLDEHRDAARQRAAALAGAFWELSMAHRRALREEEERLREIALREEEEGVPQENDDEVWDPWWGPKP